MSESADTSIIRICDKDQIEYNDLVEINNHLDDCSADLRQLIAERLANVPPENSWPILQRLLYDRDPLVRTEVCQTLGTVHHIDSMNLLLKCVLEDDDELVKAYAIMSLAEVLQYQNTEKIRRVCHVLKQLIINEKSKRVQLSIYSILYQFDSQGSYLNAIVEELSNPDYTIRCFAINRLQEIITQQNKSLIKEKTLQQKRIEKSRAVLSSIAQLEKILKEDWGMVQNH